MFQPTPTFTQNHPILVRPFTPKPFVDFLNWPRYRPLWNIVIIKLIEKRTVVTQANFHERLLFLQCFHYKVIINYKVAFRMGAV